MILVLMPEWSRYAGLARGLEGSGEDVRLERDVDLSSMRDVRAAVERARPSAVIYAGAFEDADRAEAESDRAFALNAEAVISVAAAALEFDAVAVLLSTAEVYGGRGGPWSEADEPEPRSVWATSLLKGERFLSRAAKRWLIVRSADVLEDELASWRAALSSGEVLAAEDELTSAIAAVDLGACVAGLLQNGATGIFHAAPSGPAVSRADLWRAVARTLGAEDRVRVVRAQEIERSAPRAKIAALIADKLKNKVGDLVRPLSQVLSDPLVVGAPKLELAVSEQPAPEGLVIADRPSYAARLFTLVAGERWPPRTQDREVTLHVLEGKVVLERGEGDETEDTILKAGQGALISAGTRYTLTALTDAKAIEVGPGVSRG